MGPWGIWPMFFKAHRLLDFLKNVLQFWEGNDGFMTWKNWIDVLVSEPHESYSVCNIETSKSTWSACRQERKGILGDLQKAIPWRKQFIRDDSYHEWWPLISAYCQPWSIQHLSVQVRRVPFFRLKLSLSWGTPLLLEMLFPPPLGTWESSPNVCGTRPSTMRSSK